MKVMHTSVGRVLICASSAYHFGTREGLLRKHKAKYIVLIGDKVDLTSLPVEAVKQLISKVQFATGA